MSQTASRGLSRLDQETSSEPGRRATHSCAAPNFISSERNQTMNFLQILESILSIAPSGITLTQEIVALVQAIESAFSAGQTSPAHQQAVVAALGAHLAKQ